jgi:hypothetical protein
VDSCYAKHGHPNVNKGNNDSNGSRSANSVTEEGNSGSNTGLSQDQYDQLVTLLQQANLFASTQQPPLNSASNNVSASNVINDGPSPHDPSTSGNCFSFNSVSKPSYWILDSGANEHICSSSHWFKSMHSIAPISVSLPNGASILVHNAGTVCLTDKITLDNVLYSSDFTINLISISKMCHFLNCSVQFVSNQCIIQDTTSQQMIGLGDRVNGLYRLVLPKPSLTATATSHLPFSHSVSFNNTTISCNNSNVIPLSALWHFRFGHLSNSRLSDLTQMYPNISVDNKIVCDVCHFAKQRKLPFTSSNSIAKSNFELLHLDIWGPLSTPSIHGHRYFLTIVDDHSRFVWIILLKSKASVSTHVQNFVTLIETQFQVTPKVIRSDNGPEFLLSDFFALKGIIHQKSCVETPQQNGRVERKHQHILNVGRALLFQSKLPKQFWSYALLHATFLINRVPTPI